MSQKIILVGDINLLNVVDSRVPFRHVAAEFRAADIVFGNLECSLYQPSRSQTVDDDQENEGFFVSPQLGGEALKFGGIQAVGIANNVNYGATPIMASIARLDELGLPHTGAGANLVAARAPAILERRTKVGFLQRTSVYWQTNHEATRKGAGVAAMKCHTAYQLPFHRLQRGIPPSNRPGVPPVIVTWADPEYLQTFKNEVAALRPKVDLVVASFHWGLRDEVLEYMRELAHAAIEAGADIVIGHGPHDALPVECYKGKPIFYGLGSFLFLTGHHGITQSNKVGMVVRVEVEGKSIKSATFQFVRRNEANEVVLCALDKESATLEKISKGSASFNVKLTPQADQVAITLDN